MATRQRSSPGSSKDRRNTGTVSHNEDVLPSRADSSETQSREQRIALSAYLRAAERGFAPGYELEDWLTAERELDKVVAGGPTPVTRQ